LLVKYFDRITPCGPVKEELDMLLFAQNRIFQGHLMTKLFNERVFTAILLAFAMLVYAVPLGGIHYFHVGQEPSDNFNLTFNSMLQHLLQGEFDVDPDIVGMEGFQRGSHVYAYWGVFCALLRLPLTLIPGGLKLDVTALSCWIAVCIAAAIKLKTLRLVYRASAPSPLRETLYWALALALLFSGAQIQFLRTTLYQEVCFWGATLAAIFIYLAVRGVAAGAFRTSALCWMAALAGLALLTRVSVGVGLTAGLGLLLIAGLLRDYLTSSGSTKTARPYISRLISGNIIWPALVVLLFIFLTGWINYERWGNPLTFADYHLYKFNEEYTDRLARTDTYGLFNWTRIPFGLSYYFFPIWVLLRPDGLLLFEEHQQRLIDATELPPSSFLLTDPLLLLLTAYTAWHLLAGRRNPAIDRTRTMAIMFGLTAPWVLMLTAISMNFRYRMDFYPLMEFGAFVGFLVLCRSALPKAASDWIRGVSVALALVGTLGSMFFLLLYHLSDFGPSIETLHDGIYNYYAESVQAKLQSLPQWLAK
jgi:hypothetical protein